jgi:hypothetical protein
MFSPVIKAYLCLGLGLLAILLSAVVYTYTVADLTEVEISAVKSSKPNKVKKENAALHTTLVEGDVMFDFHGGTIAAPILGCVLIAATISLSAVKFRSWGRKPAAVAGAQNPQPQAPAPTSLVSFPTPAPCAQETTAGQGARTRELEQAVSKIIAKERSTCFHNSLQDPGHESVM